MKLRLPSLLCTALLAYMTCSSAVYADTYLAEGVVISSVDLDRTDYIYKATLDTEASDRFYDGGKGRDWGTFSSAAYNLYANNQKDLNVFGDLASSITAGSSSLNFNNLKNDSGHCWAYTSSNMIQHWQSYYGVFANKVGETQNPTPVHGYSYDKAHVETLGGTQSLKLNKLFYDNWAGEYGGTTSTAFTWYLAGKNDNTNLTGSDSGGYFKQYFTDPSSTNLVTSVWNTSAAGTISQDAFNQSIKTHFGYEQMEDGSWERTTKGQIMYLELVKNPNVTASSHAITCYGFDTDDSGNITALYIVNSDDAQYKIVKVFGKLTSYGYQLYSNEACSITWNNWRVTGWSSINTPEVLKNMLAEYESGKLTWMGNLESWTNTAAVEEDVNVLPTDETGWMTYAGTGTDHAGYYNTYYSTGRSVEFNDEATNSTVSVAEDITVTDMAVNNSVLDYTFKGKGETITADSLSKTGTGALVFDGVKLYTEGKVTANGNSITFTDDADIGSIDESTLIIKGGETNIRNSESWTKLKSLEISDEASLTVGASLEVAGNISETEASGTLAEGSSAGISATYCISVGTAGDEATGNVRLTGDMKAGSYIHILGDANISGNVSSTGTSFGTNDSHITIGGDATIGGNLTAANYISIGGDAHIGGNLSSENDVTIGGNGTIEGAVNVSGKLTATGNLTLNQGGTVSGSLLADTITLKGDTSIQKIGTDTEELSSQGSATLVVSSGSSSLNTTWWTNLKALQLSNQAKLSFTTSVSVADSISTCAATGTLPQGTEAGLETTYCIYVGTKDKAGTGNVNLAGNMTAGAYIEILGDATVTKVNNSLGNVSAREYLIIEGDANIAGNAGTVGKTKSETAYEVHDSYISIGGNATIGGDLTAIAKESGKLADITIGGDAIIGGNLSAQSAQDSGTGASITIEGDATIGGKIQTKGDITIGGNLTMAANKTLTAQSLSVGGALKGAGSESTKTSLTTTEGMTLNGDVSNVSLTAKDITIGTVGSAHALDSLDITLTGGELTLNDVTVTGNSTFTPAEGQTQLTLNATNVTFVLDGSNSYSLDAQFQPFALISEDELVTTTTAPKTFVINSGMLENLNVNGSVTLDLSHWQDAIEAGGYENITLAFADDMSYEQGSTVQATFNGSDFVAADATADNTATFSVSKLSGGDAVPEPTTATLSLLALAALAARRRRK